MSSHESTESTTQACKATPPSHKITVPQNRHTVHTYLSGTTYCIRAHGIQKPGQNLFIENVKGKVYGTYADANNATSPPDAGTTQGVPVFNSSGIAEYAFEDSEGKAIPVNEIDTDNNFLQVWVLFEGSNGNYTPADAVVRFTPTAS